MKIVEIEKDLMTVANDYMLLHCISADLAMGAGIAVEFTRRGVRDYLMRNEADNAKVGRCLVSHVTPWVAELNLVTKENCWGKPTYSSLALALADARDVCMRIKQAGTPLKLAMPRIGCGLDRLNWDKVKPIIEDVFADTDVEILVCNWSGRIDRF